MTLRRFLPRSALNALVNRLQQEGYRVVGPQQRNGAIVYDTIHDAAILPRGIADDQAPGRYRLREGDPARCFAWANGPQALKPLLFMPSEAVWQSERLAGGGLSFNSLPVRALPTAVLAVRACDLAALALQDRHFLNGAVPDPGYAARRAALFLVAVHCTHPAATCFCASTGDGPRATHGFDLALSELDDGFLVEAGSNAGRRVMDDLPLTEAREDQCRTADREIEAAATQQVRKLPGRNLRDLLFSRLEDPRWQQVAERCLSCGNCTSVCPTCFCSREYDEVVLAGQAATHQREWDSCFTGTHSYIHGVTIRSGTRERYRQWLTHKLAGWHDQYGRSGCVGCGRCLSWCPAGIDLTEETAALAAGTDAA